MKSLILNFLIFNIIVYDNVLVFACTSSEPIVDTKNGKVKGEKIKGSEGDEFCSFRGIPYAKPPIGELRFSDPEPAEPWTGIRETKTYGAICAQHNFMTNRIIGEEDCLYLNIFTKNTNLNVKQPVMVWIHGGAFACGSGNDELYGPDYFMRKDVVLVTINYRLGILGFLNLNDEAAAGNQGLKDQVMALKWVRDNIANFGGNPNNVVIFGESAGAASVHYLAISPAAKGLFHKVILQSGVAINPWAHQSSSEERAYEICTKLNHTEKNPKTIITFLRTVDAKQLLKAQKELMSKEDKLQLNCGFLPSIDSKSKNPFMPIHPKIAIEKGIDVPLIIGQTSREGILVIKIIQGLRDQLSQDYVKFMNSNFIDIIKKYVLTIESLKQIYFKDELVTQENNGNLVDLLGDIHFVEGIHQVIKVQIEKGLQPTYFYQFTYDKETSPIKFLLGGSKLSGACHGDELYYLFRHEVLTGRMKFPEKGSDRYRIMEQMIELWVNFATTGRPTISTSELIPFDWTSVNNKSVFSCLNICENPRMENISNIEQKLNHSNLSKIRK